MIREEIKIAIIGMGYVGTPLAVEFAKRYPVVGFDISPARISELASGHDSTLEVSDFELQSVLPAGASEKDDCAGLRLTTEPNKLTTCNYYIVTVPTPTDKNNQPVLTPLLKASETVGSVLKKNDLVIYESTVYPGATEDDCVPVLEKFSGLKMNEDFFVGYSPERINPGDKEHTVTKIRKVTSGSTLEAGIRVNELYASIITAGTYLAPSIKVAEAAKVIENTQRDINIAFVNELSKIFSKIGIDTYDVLEAASTKWNFLSFKPGLVGGHCIGVDPYYLAQKAQETGYIPEIILAGRRLNNSMGEYVASQVIKLMIKKGQAISGSKVLVLGITFKENCPDIRNTKVIGVIHELLHYGCEVDVYDPWAHEAEVWEEYKLKLCEGYLGKKYDAVVMAVAHSQFRDINLPLLRNGNNTVVYDIKGFWDKSLVDGRL